MLTVYEVKNFIRADDDDEAIKSLMDAAESYLIGAVDNFEEKYKNADKSWQAKADLAKKLLIADWYENREPVEKPKIDSVTLLIGQLQLEGVKYGNENLENSGF